MRASGHMPNFWHTQVECQWVKARQLKILSLCDLEYPLLWLSLGLRWIYILDRECISWLRESLGYLYSTHQPADLEDLGGLTHNDNGFLIYRLHFTSCVGILMKKMTFPPNKDEHVSSLDQRGKRSLIWPNSFEVHSHLAFHIPWVCAHCSLRGREREGEKERW